MNEPYVESIAEETVADLPVESPSEEATPPAEEGVSQDATQRLAEDFLALAEEFSLLDAYLRHRLQEEKKVAAAAEKQQQAAKQSAGSLSRGAVQVPPEQDAFIRAFRSAL